MSAAQLQKSFMALPADQRATLHLVGIEGLSYQEAASTLGIPVGTLMSRLAAHVHIAVLEDATEPALRHDGSAHATAQNSRGTNDASD